MECRNFAADTRQIRCIRQNKKFSLNIYEPGDSCPAETKELFAAWIADKDNTERSIELEAQITPIVKANADKCEICKEIASLSQYLIKKSQWIIGGDGASYDIGFGGLDHVLASGKNVNILVLDTEVYSNTGGQASKATPV